jgi:predicted DNA-binding transcriptional regulator AlpA
VEVTISCVTSASTPGIRLTTLALSLDDATIESLAERVAESVITKLRDEGESDRWLDSREAADHLGISRDAIHKLHAAGVLPSSQEKAGAKLYFKRSELDRWRQERANGAA